ncbi:hypothetical protein [Actinomycetospora sp. TBRC 11914]|uniref:hypothetical protein n=1 Tax=Actinomycetospora sp. TBRC 11914 TaxID=2729387 RepID=UPI00145FBBD0|nr:hypothetical protein [Actinomycetospora sp. TBRC 11914]NMO89934.1 hypothetical protein [Actinomycetospora sp. TBRC 11914]
MGGTRHDDGGWDPGALAWLREVRDRWRALGVLGLLEDTVAAVWERNVSRHDPEVAGDTPVTLGITSSENLRTVLLRAAPEWEPRGVLIGAPWNSLAVAHEAVVLHLMKAPDRAGSRPDFATLRWVGEVRGAAATVNGLVYAPARDDRTGQLWFDGFGVPPPTRPVPPADGHVGLRHVVLVWTGAAATSTTAGWLAVPWEHDAGPTWLAALPLWAHGPDEVPAPRRVPAVSLSFDRVAPDPAPPPVRRA